jgi:hypothetical protein
MVSPSLLFISLVMLLSAATVSSISAAGQRVAVELMIAIDVSDSINQPELAFQIDGIVKAFRDERLISRIENLPSGGLAVAVMFWAGKGEQRTMVGWRRVHDRATCHALANVIEKHRQSPWSGNLFTALGDALAHAHDDIISNGFDGERRVIDISSDDPHNQGLALPQIRRKIIAEGITINGLPILTNRHEHEERKELIDYYRHKVIGGAGSFLVPALSKSDYARAMLRKLMLEIAGEMTTGNEPG